MKDHAATPSILYTQASQDLEKEVEQELTKEDPTNEQTEAKINENTTWDDGRGTSQDN